MTTLAQAPGELPFGDQLARRNALVLALAQALAGANNTVMLVTGTIAGAMLAPDKALSTLPVSIYVVGMWLGTLPVGALSRRFGRRTAFQLGTVCGVLTGLICCVAIVQGSFVLLNVGAFFSGLYAAAHQAYRFAAADTASDAFKPKAISWVLIGGIAAGILGPQLVIFTKDVWQPYLFAASYLAQAAVALLAGLALTQLNIPHQSTRSRDDRGRPLSAVVRQPRFMVAVACGVASYGMMNLVMTSAPLAMVMCNHSVTDATLGLQWHVIGMYAPSFFTGALIARFGVERVAGAGLALLAGSAALSIAGITLWHFWIALTVLGVGWNFAFIGATTMVVRCHRPEERTRVQAFNDFLVFGSMAIGSFASGTMLATAGWTAVNAMVFPVTGIAFLLLVWVMLKERHQLA